MASTIEKTNTLLSLSGIEGCVAVILIASVMLFAIWMLLKEKQSINIKRDSSLEKAIIAHLLHTLKLDFVCDILRIDRFDAPPSKPKTYSKSALNTSPRD